MFLSGDLCYVSNTFVSMISPIDSLFSASFRKGMIDLSLESITELERDKFDLQSPIRRSTRITFHTKLLSALREKH